MMATFTIPCDERSWIRLGSSGKTSPNNIRYGGVWFVTRFSCPKHVMKTAAPILCPILLSGMSSSACYKWSVTTVGRRMPVSPACSVLSMRTPSTIVFSLVHRK